jgi:hypothetical protein
MGELQPFPAPARKFLLPLTLARKQEFRRTDFGNRLLAAEGEGGGGGTVRVRGVSEVKQYSSGSG